MGMNEMASMLSHPVLNNECNDNEQMLHPQPDQTDTIDGEFFLHLYWMTTNVLRLNMV